MSKSSEFIKELISELNNDLKEMRDMAQILGQDCHEQYLIIQDDDNQMYRRAYIRSVFAFIEGLLHRMKLTAAHFGGSMGTLSVEELIMINGVSFDVDDKGEVLTKSVFPKFLNNVKFGFKVFSKSFGSSFELNLGGNGWQSLRDAVKVRDRLMHPKEASNLQLTDTEVMAAKNAFDWFFTNNALCGYYAQKAVQNKTSPNLERVANLDIMILELETWMQKNKM